MKSKIGIRPIIDGRCGGIRESLEEQTMNMALNAKKIIEENVFYSDGTRCEVVIAPSTISGGAESAKCEEFFSSQNVIATLSVTPCWCYGTETMDLNPNTIKAVWGFNGTERPGAVYLSAVMAGYNQRDLPAFSIYGKDVCDVDQSGITQDVEEKIIRFARCSLVVGQMKNKSYVGLGSVCMGIAGSFLNPDFMQKYLGIRSEWIDMTEILRRVEKNIFDKEEYEKALDWTIKNCKIGEDKNKTDWKILIEKADTDIEQKEKIEFSVKMTLIIRDIMIGNKKLAQIGWKEEALGKNAILGGFQGQRQWTDFKPNGDFAEAMLNTTFDWNGKKEPNILATENDGLNGLCMLFGKLLTGKASVFADVRTYWSPKAVEKMCDWKPTDKAENGFIHLINSGAAALDGSGVCRNDKGEPTMKSWWDINAEDQKAMLDATTWMPANKGYFRGGGFSSQFKTQVEMPVTLLRINIIGDMPTIQIAEGWTVDLPKEIDCALLNRTDPTWPSTWFVPRLDKNQNAFSSVYNVMANWGANHGAFVYGHIGNDIITLASMLRIPVSLHNIKDEKIFRPHVWSAFGTKDLESADYRACQKYGPLYK